MRSQTDNPVEKTEVFVRLLLTAEPRLRVFLRCQILNRSDAEDVFQDTATVLWKKFGEFKPGTDFVAWSYQVARYEVLKYYRERASERPEVSSAFLDAVAAKSQELSRFAGETMNALRLCMEKLRPRDREILQRCYAPQATIRSVAEQLNQPVGTVNSIVQRTRRTLFECIQRSLARESHQ